MTCASTVLEHKVVCPECNGTLLSTDAEIVCKGCGLVVGPADFSSKEESAQFSGSGDGTGADGPGSSPDLPYFAGAVERRLRTSDLISKHVSLDRGFRAYSLGDLMAGTLALSRVQLSTALVLLDKVKSSSRTKFRTCDLLGAAFIISSRRTGSVRHLTITRVVQALGSIGYRTRPRNIIQALSHFKEQGLYAGSKTAEEHLQDILSGLDVTSVRQLSSDVGSMHEVAIARELSHEILSRANAHKVVSNPRSRAACSVYAAFNVAKPRPSGKRLRISFSRIARASGLAEYTIRDNYERHFSEFLLRIPV